MKRIHHHAKYDLKYRLVLVTKYRKKCITKGMLNRLEKIVRDVCKKWDVEILEFSGEEDHIHLLISSFFNEAINDLCSFQIHIPIIILV